MNECNFDGWDGYNAPSVSEEEIDLGIEMANELRLYFEENGIDIDKPYLSPYGDLDFYSYERGYGMFIDFYPEDGFISAYGRNKCRNWKNKKERELRTSNDKITRKILVLFAKWLENKKADWCIEIEKV